MKELHFTFPFAKERRCLQHMRIRFVQEQRVLELSVALQCRSGSGRRSMQLGRFKPLIFVHVSQRNYARPLTVAIMCTGQCMRHDCSKWQSAPSFSTVSEVTDPGGSASAPLLAEHYPLSDFRPTLLHLDIQLSPPPSSSTFFPRGERLYSK